MRDERYWEILDIGRVGAQHIRTIVKTAAEVPTGVSSAAWTTCESAFFNIGTDCDPKFP